MKPLDGVVVLDFTQAYSGPTCAMNLADYGARIIKVERKGIGDQSRYWAPFTKDGNSGYFAVVNRNKESIALDLSSKEGQDIIKLILPHVDIVLENFKVGTLDKMGLGYEELIKINPSIVFASLTGYGQYGSNKSLAAYDNIIEATCGLMERSGFADSNPVRSGASIGDSYTGFMTAMAISIAYYHRLKTGEGQRVDVAMQDCLIASIEEAMLEYGLNKNVLSRNGNSAQNLIAPYDVYECADGWFAIGSASDGAWPEFCEDIGMPELISDPDFASNESRLENLDKLTAKVSPFFAGKTREELQKHFRCHKLSASPVYTVAETMQQRHIKARNMLIKVDDPNIGTYESFGIPIKFEKTPGEIYSPSPLIGQHTEKILDEFGFTKDKIRNLLDEGVIEMPA